MFVYLALLSCVSHSTDLWNEVIQNIRYMHAVSTSQIADILHFNDNKNVLYSALYNYSIHYNII